MQWKQAAVSVIVKVPKQATDQIHGILSKSLITLIAYHREIHKLYKFSVHALQVCTVHAYSVNYYIYKVTLEGDKMRCGALRSLPFGTSWYRFQRGEGQRIHVYVYVNLASRKTPPPRVPNAAPDTNPACTVHVTPAQLLEWPGTCNITQTISGRGVGGGYHPLCKVTKCPLPCTTPMPAFLVQGETWSSFGWKGKLRCMHRNGIPQLYHCMSGIHCVNARLLGPRLEIFVVWPIHILFMENDCITILGRLRSVSLKVYTAAATAAVAVVL